MRVDVLKMLVPGHSRSMVWVLVHSILSWYFAATDCAIYVRFPLSSGSVFHSLKARFTVVVSARCHLQLVSFNHV
jgi:hypothetical protein